MKSKHRIWVPPDPLLTCNRSCPSLLHFLWALRVCLCFKFFLGLSHACCSTSQGERTRVMVSYFSWHRTHFAEFPSLDLQFGHSCYRLIWTFITLYCTGMMRAEIVSSMFEAALRQITLPVPCLTMYWSHTAYQFPLYRDSSPTS